jgi:hypothetical protein
MAAQAVLSHRRVFHHEWSPLFGMTLVTQLINRIRREHVLPKTAMDRMAIGASCLALSNRVVGLSHRFCPQLFVATKA